MAPRVQAFHSTSGYRSRLAATVLHRGRHRLSDAGLARQIMQWLRWSCDLCMRQLAPPQRALDVVPIKLEHQLTIFVNFGGVSRETFSRFSRPFSNYKDCKGSYPHSRKQRGPALHSTRPGLSSHTSICKEVRKLPSADSWLCSQGFPMLEQRVLDAQTLG